MPGTLHKQTQIEASKCLQVTKWNPKGTSSQPPALSANLAWLQPSVYESLSLYSWSILVWHFLIWINFCSNKLLIFFVCLSLSFNSPSTCHASWSLLGFSMMKLLSRWLCFSQTRGTGFHGILPALSPELPAIAPGQSMQTERKERGSRLYPDLNHCQCAARKPTFFSTILELRLTMIKPAPIALLLQEKFSKNP